MSALGQAALRAADVLSDFGEKHGSDALTYNPLRMYQFHRQAATDATVVAVSLLETFPTARSFADVGSGSGVYAAELARRGATVVGCERSRAGRALAKAQGATTVPFDLTEEPSARLPRAVDVAYTIEVAEHLPPALGDRLVGFVADLAPVVVFTAAQPGQGGTGHINEQPPDYWHERFAGHHHVLDQDRTEAIREKLRAGGVEAPWLVANIHVYAR